MPTCRQAWPGTGTVRPGIARRLLACASASAVLDCWSAHLHLGPRGRERRAKVDTALEAKLKELIAKDEIRDALMRYARGVDRGDPDLITSAFHPDAVDDHGGTTLVGTEAGPRFTGTRKLSASGAAGQHFMGNITIELEGDTAYTESYFVSYLIVDRDGAEYTRFRGARYIDRFEPRQGAWQIAYRVVADDRDPMANATAPAPMRPLC